ncbi:formate dehydrogenase accessory sulfurtransferase FdhD, partial [Rhizobium ruizarguesonis]
LGSPVLIAISAPTALAIRTSEEAVMTLVALVRGEDFAIFTHPHRLFDRFDAAAWQGRSAVASAAPCPQTIGDIVDQAHLHID